VASSFLEQSFVSHGLMWWNGDYAVADFCRRISVVIRATHSDLIRSKRPDALMAMVAPGMQVRIDSDRLSHHGK
jgi:hypothetical protein